MDLYFIALPIYAVLLVFSFVAMKLTMQEIITKEQKANDSKARQLLHDNAQKIKTGELQGEKCRIFRYLMRQHSVFAISRGKRSLVLFFTYSIVSLYLYTASIWQISLSFGTILSLSIFVSDIVQQKKVAEPQEADREQQMSKRWTISKVIHVACGMLTITIYLTMCGLLFKNYINSRILHLITKLGIVFAIDNFGIRPAVFMLTSLISSQSVSVLSLVSKTEKQETEVTTVKIANDFGKEIQTKNHFILNLEIEPQPIDLNKPKSLKSRRTPMKEIPNLSVNEHNELSNQDSHQNFFSRNQSSQSNLSNIPKHQQVMEVQLEKIEQCGNKDELNQYFCINLRREKNVEQNRQLQQKLETIMQNHSNIEAHILPNQFILQDFAVKSPIKIEDGNFSEKQQTCSIRNNSFCRSKASNKGIKTVRMVDKERSVEQQDNYVDQKDNTFVESTKNDLSDVHIFSKDSSFVSKGRHNKASFLQINEDLKQAGELQEIDINSPNKNRKFHKSFYDTNIIPEQQIRKARRNRRRTTKVEVSQPQLISDKLIGIYCPGQNKSQLDNYVSAKKKSLDRAVFFNRSNKKSLIKGRDKPIVHENDENQTDFYIPQFNFPINQ